MRHTKIIATIGPATNSDAQIDRLIRAGVDVFRINFSHGTHDTQGQMYKRLRAGAQRSGKPVAIMQDLAGTKIRIGHLQDGKAVRLRNGATFRISTGDFVGDADHVSTPFAGLASAVAPDNLLLLDDGRIQLRVVETNGQQITTEIVHGGMLAERKGVTAPDVRFAESGLTEKDIQDLEYGLELGVDLVAVSFVQTAEDLLKARAIVDQAAASVWLVAKIERPQAVDEIEQILEVSDAIMVARGDLGLEIPLEHVPRVQKHLTRRARYHGVPVIVATQVLDTMRVEPRPTRAEVSDAANAVDDGVDAIMLTGETADGNFPVESVKTLDAIIGDAETIEPTPVEAPPDHGHGRALVKAAVTLAVTANASGLVAVTHAGTTARQLAALRPRMPIYGATDDEGTARRLMLCWGVIPVIVDTESLALPGVPQLVAGALEAGSTIVSVRIHHEQTRDDANFVSLRQLTALDKE